MDIKLRNAFRCTACHGERPKYLALQHNQQSAEGEVGGGHNNLKPTTFQELGGGRSERAELMVVRNLCGDAAYAAR